jgi:hypothetical protein
LGQWLAGRGAPQAFRDVETVVGDTPALGGQLLEHGVDVVRDVSVVGRECCSVVVQTGGK